MPRRVTQEGPLTGRLAGTHTNTHKDTHTHTHKHGHTQRRQNKQGTQLPCNQRDKNQKQTGRALRSPAYKPLYTQTQKEPISWR